MTTPPATDALPSIWNAAIASWAVDLAREGLSPGTIANRRRALTRYASAHPHPWNVTPEALAKWLDQPGAWAPIAPKLMRSTLHTFYAWAVDAGHIDTNPAPVRGHTRKTAPEPWREALAAWADALRLDRTAPSTAQRLIRQVSFYATTDAPADPWTVTPEALAAWLRAQDWAPTTAAAVRVSLRGFYAWAVDAGHLDTSPALYLSAIARPREARPVGTRGPEAIPAPANWSGPLRLYARHQHAQGRSPETVRLRHLHLTRVARDLRPLAPWAVTFDDLVDWMSAQTLAPATRISVRQSLRGFYAWAVDAGHLDTSPATDLPKVRTLPPRPHPASENALKFAMLAADPRERLMLRLAAEMGLRRGEIARAHTQDVIEHGGGWSLIVRGKGSRDRLVPMPDALAAEVRAMPDGHVFPSPHAPAGHLTAHTVGKLIGRLLPPGVSAHALRHRFATRAYELDRDVFAVQRLLGHANPETTQRYVATGEEHLRSTVNRLAALTAAGGLAVS